MSAFDRLHPALQHHIVNSLGWTSLRPFQEVVIEPLVSGRHAIILAPTAGGKTEAAFFPVLSRMLHEDWAGLSVLYICPLKALLNNLDIRLARYADLVGRRSALWHGDVTTSARNRLLADPPDCLLTTPESLEAMLVSSRVDAQTLFARVQAVIIDEVHAFAGDDRGWHLLAVLSRITRLADRELQRVGLSATVGNPHELMEWLAGGCEGERFVSTPPQADTLGPAPAVEVDYVASTENAAMVISRLHRGEKRLVFVDSRARAEKLGHLLRGHDVDAFVTHSSLSVEQRRDAEAAFAGRENCVIVATSALELGIDIGNLDRVIQIDAPATVASFLQRMGRTGRRDGSSRNCLFLSTSAPALLQATALVELWQSGFIEPIRPPDLPFHILAQQIMALALQEQGIERLRWREWLTRWPALMTMPPEQVESVVGWMLEQEILWEEGGVLWFGSRGEREFSRRNFLELLSVFTSPPLLRVLHGRQEIGLVDQTVLSLQRNRQQALLLAGRAWVIRHIDWTRRVVHVVPTDAKGRAQWLGGPSAMGFELCQRIRSVLLAEDAPTFLSRRGREQLESIREEDANLVDPDRTVLTRAGDRWRWWTFAGTRANAALASAVGAAVGADLTDADGLMAQIDCGVSADAIDEAIDRLRQQPEAVRGAGPDEEQIEGLKFGQCLPRGVAEAMLTQRQADPTAVAGVLGLRVVMGSR